MADNQSEQFKPLSLEKLGEILNVTVKRDETNKLITFLCALSAYTEDSQFNISFNSPSSSGKTYIPLEIAALFPKEDVIELGYSSPTAFFHDAKFDAKEQVYKADYSRKILIFLDQPHNDLLGRLRPLLSHDQKEIPLKITDKDPKFGLKTKNILLQGYPAVIFCTAGLKIDEQEATRFFLLSAETSEEKVREGIKEKIKRESDPQQYGRELESNEARTRLKERILEIKKEKISAIRIEFPEKIQTYFLSSGKVLKPRHMRDVGKVFSLIKSLALLNLWFRKKEGATIVANEKDIEDGLSLWQAIGEPQELNLPPFVYDIFKEIICPLGGEGRKGISKKAISEKHVKQYGRSMPDWKWDREILPMLESAGLVTRDPDPEDGRRWLIYLKN